MKPQNGAEQASRLSPNSKKSRTGRMRVPQWLALSAFFLISNSAISTAYAQQYSIDWYKVSGGGGTSTGATYTVSGTIGQHDAGGPMTGGAYALTGGFWSLLSVVQTPGAPTLYISHSGTTVTVFWQDVPGWILEQNSNLTTVPWSTNTLWTTSSGTNYLNLTSPSGKQFFRLAQ